MDGDEAPVVPELTQWEQLASADPTGAASADWKELGAQALVGTLSGTGPWGKEDILERQERKLPNTENVPNTT